MQQMLRGGIDWVPREILSFTVNKAIALTTTPGAVTCQSNDKVIVSSLSNPRKPHIVNVFSNGKTDCGNCPGFTSSSVCKHAIAANIKLGTLKQVV